MDPTTTRTLVHFVGGPWDAMHSHYRGVAQQAPMDCPGGRYAFQHADGAARSCTSSAPRAPTATYKNSWFSPPKISETEPSR